MTENKPKTCLENLHICNASCCRELSFDQGGHMTDMIKDYYTKHGCKVIRLSRALNRIVIPMICPQLDQATNLCKLHGTDEKPRPCQKLSADTMKEEHYRCTEGCMYGKN